MGSPDVSGEKGDCSRAEMSRMAPNGVCPMIAWLVLPGRISLERR